VAIPVCLPPVELSGGWDSNPQLRRPKRSNSFRHYLITVVVHSVIAERGQPNPSLYFNAISLMRLHCGDVFIYCYY
jgi:hypothetical protein